MSLEAAPGGTIRYTLDGSEPGPDSPEYRQPLTIGEKDCREKGLAWHGPTKRHRRRASLATLRARLFGPDGAPVGHVRSIDFCRIVPHARYRVYPSQDVLEPRKGHYREMPDVDSMKPERSGVWPDLMFGLPGGTRTLWHVPMGGAIVSEGRIGIPAAGRYSFRLEGVKGEVRVDGRKVPETAADLAAGPHSIEVRYFYGGPHDSRIHRVLCAREGESPRDVSEILLPLE